MHIRRRLKVLAGGKSPSTEAMKRLYTRVQQSGGVTVDFSANVESIRGISRSLSYNILSDASLVYTPSSYGESRNYVVQPVKVNLAKASEDCTNSTAVAWTAGGATITADAIANPVDGAITADMWDDTNASSAPGVPTQQVIPTTSTKMTVSLYTKAGSLPTSGSRVFLVRNRTTLTNFISLTFFYNTTGITTHPGGWTSYQLANGWYRIVWTGTTGITIGDTLDVYVGRSGQATVGATDTWYIYGLQVEAGDTVTPYQRATDSIFDFQFSRASTATSISKAGIFEDTCYNLLQRSEEFNTTWTTSRTTVSANQTTNPRNGLTDADKITIDSTSGNHFVSQNITTNGTGVSTMSVYVKYVDNKYIRLFNFNQSGIVNFDILNKNIATNTSGYSASITDVGNGWLLLQGTFNNTATFGYGIYLLDDSQTLNYLGDGIRSVYVWGAQMVSGSVARDYLRTTNRQAVPKLDYSLSATTPSLLSEPQRTNLLLNSATGTTQNVTTLNQLYALSFYGTGSYTLSGTATGTLTGTGVNNRVVMTFTPTAGTLTLTVSGTITNVQLETSGSVTAIDATSYIPTVGSTVARTADTMFIDLLNGSLFNKNNFTLYWECYTINGLLNQKSLVLSDASVPNANTNQVGWYEKVRAFIAVGGVSTTFGSQSNNAYYKVAVTYDGTNLRYYGNGILINTTSFTAFDFRYLVLGVGSIQASTHQTQKIALWRRTLSNTEAINLTYRPEGLPSPPVADATSNLVAYYKLDNNANDSVVSSNNGTATGITYTAGKTGNAAIFDSASDRIDIPDSDVLSFTDGTNDFAYTINTWVYVTAFNTDTNIIAYKANTAGSAFEWAVSIEDFNRVRISKTDKVSTSIGQSIKSPINSIALNTWYMITITDDGSKTEAGMNIYINANLQSKTSSSIGTYTGMANTTGIVRLGQIPWSTTVTTTNHLGYIEDIGFWKGRALSQIDITYLYNGGAGRTYPL